MQCMRSRRAASAAPRSRNAANAAYASHEMPLDLGALRPACPASSAAFFEVCADAGTCLALGVSKMHRMVDGLAYL